MAGALRGPDAVPAGRGVVVRHLFGTAGRTHHPGHRRRLPEFLVERVFQPLGMVDTGFSVPADKLDRFASYYRTGPAGRLEPADGPDGQWSTLPPFPLGNGGLVGTADDWFAFARMLLAGGRTVDGRRLLSADSVQLMINNHTTHAQRMIGESSWKGRVGASAARLTSRRSMRGTCRDAMAGSAGPGPQLTSHRRRARRHPAHPSGGRRPDCAGMDARLLAARRQPRLEAKHERVRVTSCGRLMGESEDRARLTTQDTVS